MVYSLCIAAGSLMLISFCSISGANANSAYYDSKTNKAELYDDDHLLNVAQSIRSGNGFACFAYLLAFFVLFYAAIYVSPQCCGSVNEKKMLGRPEELDGGAYVQYNDAGATNNV
jgi:hypothetical protein